MTEVLLVAIAFGAGIIGVVYSIRAIIWQRRAEDELIHRLMDHGEFRRWLLEYIEWLDREGSAPDEKLSEIDQLIRREAARLQEGRGEVEDALSQPQRGRTQYIRKLMSESIHELEKQP